MSARMSSGVESQGYVMLIVGIIVAAVAFYVALAFYDATKETMKDVDVDPKAKAWLTAAVSLIVLLVVGYLAIRFSKQ